MQQYILKRLLLTIPTILGAITLVFFAIHFAPGDPVALFIPPDLPPSQTADLEKQVNAKYGFDKPIYVQYFRYVSHLARFDFGNSLREGTPVRRSLEERVPFTLRLGLASLFISTILGIGIGVVSAIYRGTLIDNFAMFFALFGVSVPSFWLGLTLILVFAVRLPWLPPTGLGGSTFSLDPVLHSVIGVTTRTSSSRLRQLPRM